MADKRLYDYPLSEGGGEEELAKLPPSLRQAVAPTVQRETEEEEARQRRQQAVAAGLRPRDYQGREAWLDPETGDTAVLDPFTGQWEIIPPTQGQVATLQAIQIAEAKRRRQAAIETLVGLPASLLGAWMGGPIGGRVLGGTTGRLLGEAWGSLAPYAAVTAATRGDFPNEEEVALSFLGPLMGRSVSAMGRGGLRKLPGSQEVRSRLAMTGARGSVEEITDRPLGLDELAGRIIQPPDVDLHRTLYTQAMASAGTLRMKPKDLAPNILQTIRQWRRRGKPADKIIDPATARVYSKENVAGLVELGADLNQMARDKDLPGVVAHAIDDMREALVKDLQRLTERYANTPVGQAARLHLEADKYYRHYATAQGVGELMERFGRSKVTQDPRFPFRVTLGNVRAELQRPSTIQTRQLIEKDIPKLEGQLGLPPGTLHGKLDKAVAALERISPQPPSYRTPLFMLGSRIGTGALAGGLLGGGLPGAAVGAVALPTAMSGVRAAVRGSPAIQRAIERATIRPLVPQTRMAPMVGRTAAEVPLFLSKYGQEAEEEEEETP